MAIPYPPPESTPNYGTSPLTLTLYMHQIDAVAETQLFLGSVFMRFCVFLKTSKDVKFGEIEK